MKTLIAYFSETGNTKKLARLIFDTVSGDKIIKQLSEVHNVNDFDLVYIGFPIHSFGPCNAAKEFINKIKENQKVVLFVTHAMPNEIPMNNTQIENCKNEAKHLDLLAFYSCRGELSEAMAEEMMNSEDRQFQLFGKLRNQTVGHPDQKEIDDLKEFVEETQALL